jgi:hypothetical protein
MSDNPKALYPLDASLTLAESAPKWLAEHQHYIQPNTVKGYRNALEILIPSFPEIPVKSISIDHIRTYQKERNAKAGACMIISELSVLQMILKEAGEWSRLREFYKPLRVPRRGAGHSLTQEEEGRQVKSSVRELSPSPCPKINKAPVVPATNSLPAGFSSTFTFTGGFYVIGNA